MPRLTPMEKIERVIQRLREIKEDYSFSDEDAAIDTLILKAHDLKNTMICEEVMEPGKGKRHDTL